MDSQNQNQSVSSMPFTIHKSIRGNKDQILESIPNTIQASEPQATNQPTQPPKIKKKEEKTQQKQVQMQNQHAATLNNMTQLQEPENAQMSQEQKNQKLQRDYEQKYSQYINEDFTHQANNFLKQIARDSQNSTIANHYPLYKLLRAVAKKFLFNELEILIYAYILQQNEWKYLDEKVNQYADQLEDFLNLTDAYDMHDYKCLLLYLILNAYAVKFYINFPEEMEIIERHLNQICPNFIQIFTAWSKLYATASLRINPKVLNQIFKELSAKPNLERKKQNQDYNNLVDQIMLISPPYNNDKSSSAPANLSQSQNQVAQQPSTIFNNSSAMPMKLPAQPIASHIQPHHQHQPNNFPQTIIFNQNFNQSAFQPANSLNQQNKLQKLNSQNMQGPIISKPTLNAPNNNNIAAIMKQMNQNMNPISNNFMNATSTNAPDDLIDNIPLPTLNNQNSTASNIELPQFGLNHQPNTSQQLQNLLDMGNDLPLNNFLPFSRNQSINRNEPPMFDVNMNDENNNFMMTLKSQQSNIFGNQLLFNKTNGQ